MPSRLVAWYVSPACLTVCVRLCVRTHAWCWDVDQATGNQEYEIRVCVRCSGHGQTIYIRTYWALRWYGKNVMNTFKTVAEVTLWRKVFVFIDM